MGSAQYDLKFGAITHTTAVALHLKLKLFFKNLCRCICTVDAVPP